MEAKGDKDKNKVRVLSKFEILQKVDELIENNVDEVVEIGIDEDDGSLVVYDGTTRQR